MRALLAVGALAAVVTLTGCGPASTGSTGSNESNEERCHRVSAVLDDTSQKVDPDDAAFWLNHCDATAGSDGGYVPGS